VLLDGTLIFWPLEAKDQQFKNLFFPRYCAHLQKLCDQGVPVASYISLPRSRDLVNLVRFALCEGEPDINDAHTAVNHVVDAAIVHSFLAPYTRTTVFKATQAICAEYPAALRPYFFYLHVGSEIARVELPEWVARNTDVVNMLAGVILDQTLKGSGYPVVIAEAHEQAVVKGPDRDFFYHIIRRFGVEQKKNLAVSQKSFKKRGLGI
jgi:hypothetical protein